MALKATDGIISAEFVERTHNGRGGGGAQGRWGRWRAGGWSGTDPRGGMKEEEGRATTIGAQD